MDRKEFDKLTIQEQIDFINKELKSGKSLGTITNEIIIDRATIRTRFKKINYLFDDNIKQYVYIEDKEKAAPKEKNISKSEIKKTDNTLVEIFTNEVLKDNLINLAMNYNRIIEMLDTHENKSLQIYDDDVIEPNLRNRLLREKDKNVRTTIRANEDILKDFDKFCSENKDYLKQDLISSALYEFLEKRGFYQ